MHKDLEDCKKCRDHVRMMFPDMVVCNRLKDSHTTVIVQPANYQKPFTNDQKIVDCKK